jgi:hypothetical protein
MSDPSGYLAARRLLEAAREGLRRGRSEFRDKLDERIGEAEVWGARSITLTLDEANVLCSLLLEFP